MRDVIVICAIVACGSYKQYARVVSSIYHIRHSLGVATAAPAIAQCDHRNVMIQFHHNGIVRRRQCIRGRAIATCVQELQGHYTGVPVNTNNSFIIVSHSGYSAGAMCSVTMVVHRVFVAIAEIPAVDVIFKAISVIILFVIGYLRFIDPHIAREV